jgi:hypothetical protein
VAADEEDVIDAGVQRDVLGELHAVRDHQVVAGRVGACCLGRSVGDSDFDVDPLEQEPPERHAGHAPARGPAAWKVATVGQVADASAATPRAGVSGSWMWSTSKRSTISARRSRRIAAGLNTMLAREWLGGCDHRTPERDHVRRRWVEAAGCRVQEPCQPSRWVMPDQDLRFDAQIRECGRLLFGVLDDSAPEGGAVGNDDSELHAAVCGLATLYIIT